MFLDRVASYFRRPSIDAITDNIRSEVTREAKAAMYEALRDAAGPAATAFDEAFRELELALEDRGWRQLTLSGEREFSRAGLLAISKLCRLMYLKNPLCNRAAEIQALYVFGQGVTFTSDDERTKAELDSLAKERLIKNVLGHEALHRSECTLQTTGNLFWQLAVGPGGDVEPRSIPSDEITEILANPEDAADVWYYLRVWQDAAGQGYQAWYPARGAKPAAGAVDLRKIAVKESEVIHAKVGCLQDMQFGIPELYQAIDWARSYREYLENWSKVQAALAQFAWKLNPGGGSKGVQTAKSRLGTQLGGGEAGGDSNPPYQTGSVFLNPGGANLEPIKTAGAQTPPDQGKRLLLMVCAATGKPETFFGDLSVGNHATAKTLDRPTELQITSRQRSWSQWLTEILTAVLASRGIQDPNVQVTFPPILEHSVTETIAAISEGATMAGHPLAGTLPLETITRQVCRALGITDVEPIVRQVLKDKADADAAAAELQKQMASNPPPPADSKPPTKLA